MIRSEVEEEEGQWTSMFPAGQATEIKSTLFVKKLLAVAVSTISYLRALFPEDAFGDRCLEDIQLKILRDDTAFPGACTVIQWLRGCFDALEKKYLRTVLVGIYENIEDPESVIEEYSFRFSYGDGKGMDIYRNGEMILSDAFSDYDDEKLDKEVKKSTVRMLRTIVILSQTFTSLPDNVVMAMKLLYYDEITPEDYNPPGFKDCESHEFLFKEKPNNVKLGSVATNFHALKIRVRTLHGEPQQTDVEKEVQKEKGDNNVDATEEEVVTADEEAVVPSDVEEILNNVGKDFNNSITTLYPSIDDHIKKDSLSDEETQVVEEENGGMEVEGRGRNDEDDEVQPSNGTSSQVSSGQQQDVAHCTCGVHEDDGVMILCSYCGLWQHAVCYAITDPDDVPDNHCCVACAVKHNTNCTDAELSKHAEDNDKLTQTCLWRRALMSVVEVSRILPTSLAKRLSVPINMASMLVQRLETEGYLKAGGKGKRLGRIVLKDEIMGRGMQKYFTQKSGEVEDADFDEVAEKASRIQISGTQEDQVPSTTLERPSITRERTSDALSDYGNSQVSPTCSQRKRRKTSVHNETIFV